jgi:CYTH domain-containing protein
MGLEIEKKYIIENVPENIKLENKKEIHQTYLATGKQEIRVRKVIKNEANLFVMTIKTGKGLVREEVELSILETTYNQLLTNNYKIPLRKVRSKIVIDGNEFDYDEYLNTKERGLKTIEIEFDNEDEANNFVKPEWFGKDVTENKSYKNQNLWLEIQNQI